MLSAAERARLVVVLVGARNPANIGAAARALRDFGFSRLVIVNDFAAPLEAAQLGAESLGAGSRGVGGQAEADPLPGANSAVGAADLLRAAQRFDSLAEALTDCTLVVGTTAIGERELTQPVLPLQQAAPRILEALQEAAQRADPLEAAAPPGTTALATAPAASVALLFGSEKTGLTNDQLSHCDLLTTIPMYAPQAAPEDAAARPPRHLSMNLGQSVAVCLYELTRAGFQGARELPVLHETPATHADRERLTQLLLEVMHATGYTRRFPANAAEPLVRRLAGQMGHSHREAVTWMGLLRQVLWHSRPGGTPEGDG